MIEKWSNEICLARVRKGFPASVLKARFAVSETLCRLLRNASPPGFHEQCGHGSHEDATLEFLRQKGSGLQSFGRMQVFEDTWTSISTINIKCHRGRLTRSIVAKALVQQCFVVGS